MRLTTSQNRTRAASKRWRIDGRGQSLVEFALVIPLFIALLFGTLEMGLLFKTRSAFQEAALEAGRAVAAAGQSADADVQALQEMQNTLSAEDLTKITKITIYRSDTQGNFFGAGSPAATVMNDSGCPATGQSATSCDNLHTYYSYSSSQHAFVCIASGNPPDSSSHLCGNESYWDPLSRNIKVPTLDHITIKIQYDYRGATGFFPTLHLTQVASTLIEPTSYGS